MRVVIPHNRPKQEVRDAVERSVDQLFAGLKVGVMEFVDQRKEWSEDTLKFALTAKLGFLQTPIVGSALVTDREITLDVDLGLLGKLIPEQSARSQIESRVRGLLT
jgi:hypothetical protein